MLLLTILSIQCGVYSYRTLHGLHIQIEEAIRGEFDDLVPVFVRKKDIFSGFVAVWVMYFAL